MAGIATADEKNILVTSGSDRATPIAVVPFGWQGGSVLPDDMAEIIEEILNIYLDLRQPGETFLSTYRRVGIAVFKERVYANAD